MKAGSVFSTNIAIDHSNIKVTKGTPKSWTKTADSGKEITSHFCGDWYESPIPSLETRSNGSAVARPCGGSEKLSAMTTSSRFEIRVSSVPTETDGNKVGVMDDTSALDNAKPAVELYAPERVAWVNSVPGTQEMKGMS